MSTGSGNGAVGGAGAGSSGSAVGGGGGSAGGEVLENFHEPVGAWPLHLPRGTLLSWEEAIEDAVHTAGNNIQDAGETASDNVSDALDDASDAVDDALN